MNFFVRSLLVILLMSCMPLYSQQLGIASFYSKKLIGRRTSDKSKYHPDSLTCAHRTFPLGSYLKVRNTNNDSVVIVKITDRGPHSRYRIIDLSYRAAKQLNFLRQGICPVEVSLLQQPDLVRDTLLATSVLSKDTVTSQLRDTLNCSILKTKQKYKAYRVKKRKYHQSKLRHKRRRMSGIKKSKNH